MVDTALATAMHAMRTNVAITLDGSPGSLVFNRDMFYNIPLITDWHAIARCHKHHVNKDLRRQNKNRRRWDHAVGDKVLKKIFAPTKLGPRTTGPYVIKTVHVNGNVTVTLREGLTERINIRRVIPYRKPG